MFIQIIKNHIRLFLAFSLGLVIELFAGNWDWVSRFLLGWNVSVWSYLLFMAWMMKHASTTKVAQLAEQEDRAELAIIAFMSIAAAASLAAIILELATLKDLSEFQKGVHYLVTAATVMGSWVFIATIFTFHYAKLYYRSPKEHRALLFPDAHSHPNYWDFLYFSFTIAVAAQTSDVMLTTRTVRKTALAQSVLSFWFNMAILGLSINIAAGLVSG